ncbi:MAG: DUF4118 domain-containing protein [Bacteroidota bacterium]
MNPRPRLPAAAGVPLILAVCTLLSALMRPHFDSAGLTMVYLLGVVVAAMAFGRGAAVVASVLSVAIFDFAFVPPRFTFRVSDAQYLVVFGVMLAVGVVTGTLTARLREQREESRMRERRTAALYRLTHDLAVRGTVSEVLQALVDRAVELFGGCVAALVPGADGALAAAAGDPRAIEASPERAAAEWAFANGQPAGSASGIPAGAAGAHVPLIAGVNVLGVLSIAPPLSNEASRSGDLLRALSSQAALAMERCRLAEEGQRIREQIEVERTRSALLSSVSHDLRTPLAAIVGAATSLRSSGDSLPGDARSELAQTISEEADRLDRLIGNLLDMTRVESGRLRVVKQWHSVEEVVGAALTRLEGSLGGRPVRVALPPDLPLVPMDDVLLEAVVRNLVENAHKYSGPEQPIEIAAAIEGRSLKLEVADRGPGLRPGDERRVFEKFYRGSQARTAPGVGLGLAICQGVVEAHGGSIVAGNRPGGGSVFTVRLPLEGAPPRVDAERAGAVAGPR